MIFVYDGGNDLLNKISEEAILKEPWPNEIEKFFKKIRNYYKTTHLIEFLDRVVQKNIFNDQNRKLEDISEDKIERKILLWSERWSEFCEREDMSEKDIIIAVQPYLGTGEKNFSNWEKMAKQNNMKTDVHIRLIISRGINLLMIASGIGLSESPLKQSFLSWYSLGNTLHTCTEYTPAGISLRSL